MGDINNRAEFSSQSELSNGRTEDSQRFDAKKDWVEPEVFDAPILAVTETGTGITADISFTYS